MTLNAYRLAATILATLVVLIPGHAFAQDAPVSAPRAVMEAIAASPAPKPAEVIVGAYINDIQQLDFKTNNYTVDLCGIHHFMPAAPDLQSGPGMTFPRPLQAY